MSGFLKFFPGFGVCDEQADVIIAGMGIAGLYCALHIDPAKKVLILNKLGERESNSIHAQGGVAAVTLSEDSTASHVRDTLEAGAGLCDEAAVRILAAEGPADMARLMELGVPFDRDAQGLVSVTREGAHSFNRILHCGGDATGLHITATLLERVRERENITILDNCMLADILRDENGEVAGALCLRGEVILRVLARSVVLATGGIGRIFKNSTNTKAATGDGIAAAFRAGAELANMEYVQFHPTALMHPGEGGRYFLISEALRGEGAVLRNRRWEAFMKKVHPLADLAPRDIVSRAIIMEMQKHDLPNVYLDITGRPREFLQERFPNIYARCMDYDIDIAVNWIPVIPVQHYFMGGVVTTADAKTSVSGLYAVGESACTGVHGANRLASNSLLECIVFGRRCAQDINGRTGGAGFVPEVSFSELPLCDLDTHTLRSQIRMAMTKKCGILRNGAGMSEALGLLNTIWEQMEGYAVSSAREVETMNMLSVARSVLLAAIDNKKSIGAHYRTDAS